MSFFGIPILPPTTSGVSRVLRITNIRGNANQVVGGGPTPGSIVASISTNGSSSLPITNSTLTVGFVQPGLNATNTTVRNATNTGGGGTTFNQCTSVSVTSTSNTATTTQTGGVQFQENFATTAFKVRYAGVSNGVATPNNGVQNVPGQIYNSESGFFLAAANFSSPGTGTSQSAGQADYGTRLKATFSNVPSGVSLFVSTRDVTNNFAVGSGAQQAVLVVGETAGDSGSQPGLSTPPQATQTAVYTTPGGVTVGIAPVVISNGSGTAVWEIVNTNPSQIGNTGQLRCLCQLLVQTRQTIRRQRRAACKSR